MIRPSQLLVRAIQVEQARPVRNAILRPGLPAETCVYPGDHASDTLHSGAFLQGRLVGVASVFREAAPFHPTENDWRLRGMAVHEEARRKGCGKALIEACLAHAKTYNGSILWCNARLSALPFYKALGFERIGNMFDIPESGLHYVLWRNIDEQIRYDEKLKTR